ncbi:MAG: hypothetical protein AMXMBFR64_04420 [Myxococcales bacterium]
MLSATFDLKTLRAIPMFAPLSDDELEYIRPHLSVRTVSTGDLAFSEGAAGDELFILLSGEVKVIKGHRLPEERVLAVLGPVEAFGEMSLLTGERRTATVVATEPSRFLTLTQEALEGVLLKHPDVSLALLRDAYTRLRKVQDRLIADSIR